MKYNRLVIFDLDGTLIDSITDVGLCFNQALSELGLPTHALSEFGKFVGGDLEQVVTKMLPAEKASDSTLVRAIGARYREIYFESDKPNTLPFKGVVELLDFLRRNNCAAAINTNKNQILAEEVVRALFKDFSFDFVLGSGGSVAPKPDREGVEIIARALGADLDNACYVGDTLSDVLTAKNANIRCYYVTWGQGNKSDTEAYDNIVVSDTVSELKKKLADFIGVKA